MTAAASPASASLLPAFDAVALLARVKRLAPLSQLAFGAACCERMAPNFEAFRRATGYGDTAVLGFATGYVWSVAMGGGVDAYQVQRWIAQCEHLAPNSEYFDSMLVTPAQDACFATCSVLGYLLNGNASEIVQAAAYATDTIDLYVQELEAMLPDSADAAPVYQHPLMQQELRRQQGELQLLESAALNPAMVARLRDLGSYAGLGSLKV